MPNPARADNEGPVFRLGRVWYVLDRNNVDDAIRMIAEVEERLPGADVKGLGSGGIFDKGHGLDNADWFGGRNFRAEKEFADLGAGTVGADNEGTCGCSGIGEVCGGGIVVSVGDVGHGFAPLDVETFEA